MALFEREEQEEVDERVEEVKDGKLDAEDSVKFEEKTLSGGLGLEEDGATEFKGFSFKKRANRGRPQIRQRIGDT